jgi:hypothetical protein
MSQNECDFLDQVKRKQHQVWLTLLLWWFAVAVTIGLVTHFTNLPDAVIDASFFASIVLLYIPAIGLYRLKCPYCHRSAGALPIFRYKFMYCKACGKRIQCEREVAQ